MHTILVIDDEEDVRNTIALALRSVGYKLLEAENGTKGLEIARQHKPDMILCDLMMPGMSGYETLAALRSDPSIANIPLVFLTGFNDPLVKERGAELGMSGYLQKPVTLDQLIEAIQTTLKKKV